MPILFKGCGGKVTKLEGDRYVTPSTSSAKTITPSSGYDGFKRAYVYGYSTISTPNSDAQSSDVMSGKTFYSEQSYRTGNIQDITNSIQSPTITYSFSSDNRTVNITSSYYHSSAGYNSSNAQKNAQEVEITMPEQTAQGQFFKTGTTTTGTITVVNEKYCVIPLFDSEKYGNTMKYCALYASSNCSTTTSTKKIPASIFIDFESHYAYVYCSQYDSSDGYVWFSNNEIDFSENSNNGGLFGGSFILPWTDYLVASKYTIYAMYE